MPLKGYRTYLIAIAIALASGARYLGWIDENAYQLIMGLLGAGAAATIRLGSKDDAAEVIKADQEECK